MQKQVWVDLSQGKKHPVLVHTPTMEVITEIGLKADLEHIRDADRIAEYKVKTTPALIINGKVMGSGGVPSKGEIHDWLKKKRP